MLCAVHPETEARGPCAVCFKNLCDACATWELEAAPCCERCGKQRDEDSQSLNAGLLAMIGVGYLATLAIGIVVFRVRPFVGGLAAVVAIALGRAMQVLVKAPSVTRRLPSSASTTSGPPPPRVDAPEPHP